MARQDYRTLGTTVYVTEVLDPELWRERYAFGVEFAGPHAKKSAEQRRAEANKRAEKGRCGRTVQEQYDDLVGALPDSTIRWHLRAALSDLELRLGIPMGVQIVRSPELDAGEVLGKTFDRLRPRMPYTHGEAATWFRLDLPDINIIEVRRVRGYYYGTKVWEISEERNNADLLKLEWPRHGVAHILPINLHSILISQGGNYGVWQTIWSRRSPIPDFWAFDYTTGPITRNGEVGKIEAVLAHWAYCKAGVLLLSISGLAQSKGLTSTSLSIDGLSKSIGLQASAIYGINSALENALNVAAKDIDWKRLRARKKGLGRVRGFSY